MELVLKTADGQSYRRKIKDFGLEGYVADVDPNAAMVITELDDTLTYLPLDMFVCEKWTNETVTVNEDWV